MKGHNVFIEIKNIPELYLLSLIWTTENLIVILNKLQLPGFLQDNNLLPRAVRWLFDRGIMSYFSMKPNAVPLI